MDTLLIPIWAGLAIWLSWLWIAFWQSYLTSSSVEILWKSPNLIGTLRIYTILWVALIESAAIYWLIVAFSILSSETIWWVDAIWAWLSIWLTWFWAAIWEWLIMSKSLEAVEKNPDNKTNVLQFMILFVALVEAVAIYWLLVSFSIIN